jgi:glycosyltransferase involved in cell wall biosynthesis
MKKTEQHHRAVSCRSSVVSILMPVKNEERHIEAAMASIVSVPSQALEVILVDDHSTDATIAIARRVAENRQDVRILVLENTGSGKAAALNLAYLHSCGDAFVLLGGDDLLVSGLLPARIAAVDGLVPAVAQCRYRSFSDDPRHDSVMFPRPGREDHLAGGATSFNRAFAELYFPIPEELPNEDTWMRALALLMGVRFRFLDAVGLHYRIHNSNSTGPTLNFTQTSLGLSRRHAAFELALQRFPNVGQAGERARLQALADAERHRASGRWWRLLWLQGLSRADSGVFLANATPWLYALKCRVLPFLKG